MYLSSFHFCTKDDGNVVKSDFAFSSSFSFFYFKSILSSSLIISQLHLRGFFAVSLAIYKSFFSCFRSIIYFYKAMMRSGC